MTPTRHIKNLLGIYGETLDDLPRPLIDQDEVDIMAYSRKDHEEAVARVGQSWFPISRRIDYSDANVIACVDFICHQSDVIDKLVAALEKARREIKVVHCADCKHRPEFKSFTDEYGHTFTDYISPDGLCPLVCDDDWYSVVRDDDWFCADGERRENGDE